MALALGSADRIRNVFEVAEGKRRDGQISAKQIQPRCHKRVRKKNNADHVPEGRGGYDPRRDTVCHGPCDTTAGRRQTGTHGHNRIRMKRSIRCY